LRKIRFGWVPVLEWKRLTRLSFNYGVIKWVPFGAQTYEKKLENAICFVVVKFNLGKQIWFYGFYGYVLLASIMEI
jgi:uncharacterized protein (DUF2235 family)